MDFQTAVRTCLRKYATFSGRASRPEYWYFVLFGFLGQLVLGIADNILFDAGQISSGPGMFSFDGGGGPLGGLFGLALLLPGLAAAVRRLHDSDRTGWWLLLVVIPLIGPLVVLYFLVQPSSPGPNRFGGQRLDPKAWGPLPEAQPWGAPPPVPQPPAADYPASNLPKVPRN